MLPLFTAGVTWRAYSLLLFEAVGRLSDEEQAVIRELLEGMIVKYEARRWTNTG